MVTRHKDSSLCEISTKKVLFVIEVYRQNSIYINLNIIITALINDKKSV
jgi:hypothetical protein